MFKDKIILDSINPLEIYGEENEKINLIKSYFPDLKITARGVTVMFEGQEKSVKKIKKLIIDIIDYAKQNKHLNNNDIQHLITQDVTGEFLDVNFQLIGKNGNLIKPKTINQKKMIELIKEKFLLGKKIG